MKVTIDIDCTPEEARTFLGLPDLSSLHQVYLERMEQLIKEGVTTADVEKMMNTWMSVGAPMMTQGFEQWQKALWSAATGKK